MSWPGTEGGDQDGDSVFEAGEQLSLSGDQDRLPWLEADEEFEEEASDYRIVIFALIAVLALAAILGGGYYLLRGGTANGDVVPDGSTIAAPEQPYKERPEDPGGAEVAGTGDISFEVGEGQSIEGQLAVETPAPEVTPESEAATPAPAPATTGVAVQVGAYSTRASAAEGWVELRNRFQVLQGLERRIVEGSVDGSTIYRLQAIASDGAAADSLCRAMRADGGDCQVKR